MLAVCTANPKLKFGNMKVAFDVSLVVIACLLLSFLFLHGLVGVGRAPWRQPFWWARSPSESMWC